MAAWASRWSRRQPQRTRRSTQSEWEGVGLGESGDVAALGDLDDSSDVAALGDLDDLVALVVDIDLL